VRKLAFQPWQAQKPKVRYLKSMWGCQDMYSVVIYDAIVDSMETKKYIDIAY
jgi:hypothetical protein